LLFWREWIQESRGGEGNKKEKEKWALTLFH
jgi:hypothetical protein